MPETSYDKIKKLLLKKQKEINQQLASLAQDDSMMNDSLAESSELGTDSWREDVQAKMAAIKNDLKNMAHKIKESLLKLERGTYGKCDHCGQEIASQRLEAIPFATACQTCLLRTAKHLKQSFV